MVSIIIPACIIDEHLRDQLILCLERLKQHTPREMYQLIIVDNGSTYSTAKMQSAADIYVRKSEGIGYGMAINIGAALADGEYLCFLSADVFVNQNWLQSLLKDLASFGDNGAIMPFDRPDEPDKLVADQVWGALWMVPRWVWNEVGPYDEELKYRYGDQDWWIRAKKSGFRIFRTTNVIVEHPTEGYCYRKTKQTEHESAEQARMMKKHGTTEFWQFIQQK
ncbi:MAG: glycosyltransferase [Patescibacteria group bacterium]|nr:glycosyltransferase [Patescibacteria group bacterium]